METIGKGKYVIIVLSDEYLRSENCMFELLKIKEMGAVHDRIFPIVLGNASAIYDSEARMNYVNYWIKKKDELQDAYDKVKDKSGTEDSVATLTLYDKIRAMTNGIIAILSDMNTLTPDMHRDSNFVNLISAIEERMQADSIKNN